MKPIQKFKVKILHLLNEKMLSQVERNLREIRRILDEENMRVPGMCGFQLTESESRQKYMRAQFPELYEK